MTIRRLFKLFIVFSGSLLVLLLAVLAGVQVFLGTGMAGRMIQERINAAIPGHIHWHSQAVSLFRGRLEIRELSVRQGTGKSGGEPMIQLDRVMANVGLLDLFSGTIAIQVARLEKPEVSLEIDEQGRLNVVRAFVPSRREPAPEDEGAEFGLNIRIDALNLTEGGFSFAMPGAGPDEPPRRIDLENIGLAVSDASLQGRAGRLELDIRSGQVDIAGIHTPLEGFELTTALSEGRLDPLRVVLQTPRSRLRVSGRAADIFEKPRLDLDLALSAELSEIQRMFRLPVGLSGPLELKATAEGDLADPDVSAALNYGSGRLAGIGVQTIGLECRMRERKVTIERLAADSAIGSLEAGGTVDLHSAFDRGFLAAPGDLQAISYRLDLDSSKTRLESLPGVSGKYAGQIASRIRLQGRGVTPEHLKAGIEARIQAKRMAVRNILQPLDADLSTKAEISGSRVSFRRLVLEARQTQIKLAGDYDWGQNHLDINADADIASLEALLDAFDFKGVSGSTAFQADISGPITSPEVEARVSARDLEAQKFPVGDLEAVFAFRNGALRVASLDLANGDSAFSLAGRIGLFDGQTGRLLSDPVLDLEIARSRVHLQDFLPDFSGRVQVAGNLSGSLRDPAGSLVIDGRNIDTGVQAIPSFQLKSRIENRRFHLEPLTVSLGEQENVQVAGWMGMDLNYELRLSSDPLDVSSIQTLAGTGLGGKLRFSADGSGRLAAPALDGRIQASGLSIGDKPLPDLDIALELRDATLRGRASHPAEMSVCFNLRTMDFDADVELEETGLAPYFQLAGRPELAGVVSGNLKAQGNALHPKEISAALDISNLMIRYQDNELLRTRDLSATLEEGRVNLPDSRISLLKQGVLNIGGSGGLNREVALTARGRIPAAIARGMVPAIADPEGGISLNARVSGTLDQPVLEATLELEDLGLTVAETLQKLHGVNGRIHITNSAITVSSLSGRLEKGEFSLDGLVELDRFVPKQADLQLSANALPLYIPDILEMKLDADLEMSGTPSQALLSGDMVLLEGLYFRDVNLSLLDTVGEITRRRRQTDPGSRQQGLGLPFLENLSLDLSLNSRKPLMVDNNLALLRIRPELRIQGSGNVPLVTGRAEVTQGTITYRDTEFEVKRGVVDFINPYRIEPTVDIQARSEVRQWIITLSVSGSPDNLDFKLTSEPALEDADIISLLAVGKTTREMASGEGGGSQSPQEMLANLVAGQVEKQVKEGTGLDIVELEYRQNGDADESEEEVRVTVGKELSRRLTVKYGVERKAGIVVQQSTAIYKLLENLSVNAYQDTEGAFGGEMRYRLEFR